MQLSFTKRGGRESGFSILEMMIATVILLIGLVAIAQLVPASMLLNQRNRTDSSALVFAQRELDQMLAQPLNAPNFTDLNGVYCPVGNTCSLGDPAETNQLQGSPVVVVNNQVLIDFTSAVAGYNFTYQDPADPNGITYDVRWAVILTGNGATVSSKRFILGVRQQGGNGFFQPITLDATVAK